MIIQLTTMGITILIFWILFGIINFIATMTYFNKTFYRYIGSNSTFDEIFLFIICIITGFGGFIAGLMVCEFFKTGFCLIKEKRITNYINLMREYKKTL